MSHTTTTTTTSNSNLLGPRQWWHHAPVSPQYLNVTLEYFVMVKLKLFVCWIYWIQWTSWPEIKNIQAGGRQNWGIKNLNKEFYLIACLLGAGVLLGCSFTSKIWLESLPVIRNTSFVSCHSTVLTWKKDQPSEWKWGKKIKYLAMWSSTVIASKNHVWICGEPVRQWFEDRSYAEILSGTNALVIINCCFIYQADCLIFIPTPKSHKLIFSYLTSKDEKRLYSSKRSQMPPHNYTSKILLFFPSTNKNSML